MLEIIGRLYELLGNRERIQALALLLGMCLGALFEALGIGLIFPFIAAIENVQNLAELPGGDLFLEMVGSYGAPTILTGLAGVLALSFVLKNGYLALLNWLQFKFVFRSQVKLSSRLFEYYLRSSYQLHLNRNSAELLRNINSECLWIFHHVMIPLFTVFAEASVVLFLGVLLFAAAPKLSLFAMLFLGILGTIILWVLRKRTARYGKLQQENLGKMIKSVNEGLGAVAETKVYGVEGSFLKQYRDSADTYANANVFLKVASVLPRLVVETLGICGIIAASIFLVHQGENLKEYLPQLGLFAVAAVRLMPSMNRVVAALTSVRYFSASLNAVYEDLHAVLPQESEVSHWVELKNHIELEDVRFSYGASPTLDEINLSIAAGESIGFVGPSGAGKSTLVGVLLGLLVPETGKIIIDGRKIEPQRGERLSVGYIPQSVRLLDATVRENVVFGSSEDCEERVWKALRAARLEDMVRELSEGLESLIGENGVRISGGQRQRLGIARALYRGANVLVFDEATSALDSETEREVTDAIKQLQGQATIIQIAHRLSTLVSCDRIYVLNQGRIVDHGNFEELTKSSNVFRGLVEASGADLK